MSLVTLLRPQALLKHNDAILKDNRGTSCHFHYCGLESGNRILLNDPCQHDKAVAMSPLPDLVVPRGEQCLPKRVGRFLASGLRTAHDRERGG
jgi:hypothetical protein